MKYTFYIFCLFFIHIQVNGQDDIVFKDELFVDFISTVQCHPVGSELGEPVVSLASGKIRFAFDDLEGDLKDYYYTIKHCDASWKATDINAAEYLDGFEEAELETFEASFNTLKNYTHYELQLPNADIKWLLSGNYVLIVYDDVPEYPLITQRFMVVDKNVNVKLDKTSTLFNGLNQKTHELDFVVSHKGFKISNAKAELKTTILQNGNWETAIHQVEPLFIKGFDLHFNYQNKIVFEAGKEFRYLDLQSFRYNTDKVGRIVRDIDKFNVDLIPEPSLVDQPYLLDEDINGKFLVLNKDAENANFTGDYAEVTFRFKKDEPFAEGDVYLISDWTNWRINSDYQMIYNPTYKCYELPLLLKQGFYNYQYAYVPFGGEKYTIAETEGNWYETRNEYTILVYYKPFGARYEQLIGAQTFLSNE